METQRIVKYIALIALVMSGFVYSGKVAAQPGVSVPVESFYNELAPYGQWIQHPGYGNVWLPNVGPDFHPYASGGNWVMTEYGNTWVSDYAWGWAPFHYGRWIFDQAYGGWLWIPGSDWAPAWVSWRSGGGYYGWAPLGPGMNINININIPAPYWTFVPQIYFASPGWYSYCVPRPNVFTIYQNTTYINNYYRSNNRAYAYGPPRGDIERITRRNVPVYRIDHMDRPGRSVVGNGSVGFYRPGGGYDNRRDYGRNDRFDNSPRPNYGGSMPSNRGYYNGPGNVPNRDYTNGTNTPNREYNGNNAPGRDYNSNAAPNRPNDGVTNVPNRGNYGGNTPTDRGGNYGTTPVPGNPQPQSNRFESNRGSYSPGVAQPGNATPGGIQQPNRSFERADRQPQLSPQSMPGARSGGEIHQMPQSGGRGMQPQQPAQGQQPGGGFNGGEHRGRGPR